MFRLLVLAICVYSLFSSCSVSAQTAPPDDYIAKSNLSEYELKNSVEHSMHFFYKAQESYRYKNYEKAIKNYKTALWFNPGDHFGKVYSGLGTVYYSQNDYDNALKYYLKASKYGIRQSKVWSNIGLAYYRLGLYSLASVFFEEALRINSSNRLASKYMTVTENKKYKDKPAVNPKKNISPEDEYLVYYKQGMEYLNEAKDYGEYESYDKAFDSFIKASEFKPDVPIFNLCALIKIEKREYTDAIYYYSKAIEANPSMAHLYANIGFSLYSISAYEPSKKLFELALHFDPENQLALNYMDSLEDLPAR